MRIKLLLLALVFSLPEKQADAQTYNYVLQPVHRSPSRPVFSHMMAHVEPAPDARFPRVNQLLQIVIDPTLALDANSTRPRSDRPFLDALPTFASVGFAIADLTFNSPIFSWTTAFAPQILRSIRVLRRGPPPEVYGRGQTILWIASPLAARAQRNYQNHGRLIWPPLRERPAFQRFVVRRSVTR